jgi:ubiquinone/menaquinone biosynthesis C-methylase UbiE
MQEIFLMSSDEFGFKYSGSELLVFSGAKNWKSYWKSRINKYVRGDILDVGAGIGSTAELFVNDIRVNSWLFLEPDKYLVNKISLKIESKIFTDKYKSLNCTTADLNLYKSFNTILYIDVLEHIEDDRSELSCAASLLSGDGFIVILVPAHQFLFSNFDKQVGHFRRYNKASLEQIIPPGLQILKMEYLDSVGVLASLASKFIFKGGSPSALQVKVWDTFFIPASKLIDLITVNCIGKSIICVLAKR